MSLEQEQSSAPAEKKHSLGRLALLMAKIGAIGFGGGNALVPVIEQVAVREEGIVDKDEFDKEVVVANITPGALPVEIASAIGRARYGARGMLAGAVAMGLPGALLTLVLLVLLDSASNFILDEVCFAAIGVAMLIVYILCEYCAHNITDKPSHSHQRKVAVAIVAVSFLVTCGGKVATLVGLPSGSIPSISTLDLLGIVFFAIFFTQGRFVRSAATPTRAVLAGLVALAYLLARNDVFGSASDTAVTALQILMLVLAVTGFARSLVSQPRKREKFPWRRFLREVGTLVVFIVACCLPALILCPDALQFCANAILSVLMSFGGGDAYLVFGEGVFVDTGLLDSDLYFGDVVTVSNAMPGSIICKVLTGVGYEIGWIYGRAASLTTALAGFGIGVGVSALTFLVIYYVYEAFESMQLFVAIRRYIRSVISGLLLTVAVTMLTLCTGIAGDFSFSLRFTTVLCIVVFAAVAWAGKVRKAGTGTLIVISMAISLAACNVVYLM